jgi:hypothetical protein
MEYSSKPGNFGPTPVWRDPAGGQVDEAEKFAVKAGTRWLNGRTTSDGGHHIGSL